MADLAVLAAPVDTIVRRKVGKGRLNRVDSCSSEDPDSAEEDAWTQRFRSAKASSALPWQSVLHELVGIGRIQQIEKHLATGISLDVPDCMGETPLFWAESAEVVDYLVGKGVDVGWRNSLSGCSAFFKFACQGKHKPLAALAQHLRQVGRLDEFIFEEASITRRTALHAAAVNDCIETVRLLLELGADRGACDRDGKTPLDLAQSRNLDAIKALLCA